MLRTQMFVRLITVSTNLHANPTDVCPTGPALHMVATFCFLDGASTFWTISGVVLLLPLCKSVVTDNIGFVLFAREAFVADCSTLGTDRGEAGGTREDFAIG